MSNSGGWYVVKFIKEKHTVEVIPSNWLIDFENCMWPTNTGILKIQSAIKNKMPPKSDWDSYPIKVICTRMFLNYNEVSKFANNTLASSSETDQLNGSNMLTKRKRTIETYVKNKKKAQNDDLRRDESCDEELTTADDVPYPT